MVVKRIGDALWGGSGGGDDGAAGRGDLRARWWVLFAFAGVFAVWLTCPLPWRREAAVGAAIGGALVASWWCLRGPGGARGTGGWRGRGFFAFASVSFGVGQVLYYYYEYVRRETPMPSLADVAFNLSYAGLLPGVLLFPSGGRAGVARGRVFVDSLLTVCAVGTFSWYFLLGPALARAPESILGMVVSVEYPVLDLVALFCLLMVSARARAPGRAIRILAAGLLVLAVGDTVFGYLVIYGLHVPGTLVELSWPVAFMLIGLAVRAARLEEGVAAEAAAPERRGATSAARALLPYALVPPTAGLVVYVVWHGGGAGLPRAGVFVGAGVIFCLLIARQMLSILDNLGLHRSAAATLAALERSHAELRQAHETLGRSEERFRIASASAGDLIYELDVASDVLEWFGDVDGNLGYPPGGFPRTLAAWERALHAEDAGRVVEELERHFREGGQFRTEYRMVGLDGRVRHWMERGTAIRDGDGKPVRMVGAVTDVTAYRTAVAELERAKESADEANRAKSAFLANMSHEIRTPISAVLGYADLLGDEGADAGERRVHLSALRRSGEHLLALINDILDLSKVEAGKLTAERIPASVGRLLAEVCAVTRAAAAEKGLALRVGLDGPVPESVLTDPTRVRQILTNLLGNAVKFTAAGEVRLTVRAVAASTEVGDAGGLVLRFDVTDTGIGLTAEQRSRLFEPFTQADDSTTRRFGGTGLGLAISRRLAQLMGGDLGVVSALGVGSTFSLVLPVGSVDGAGVLNELGDLGDGAPADRAGDEGVGVALAGRVLLAEDGSDNRRIIRHYLAGAGLEVDVVVDGRAAVDRALGAARGGRAYDVILMDMQMPLLDGYGAAAGLREAGYAGAIVALTANAMEGDRQKCLEAGCDEYATKPIRRAALLEVVGRYVRRGVAAAERVVGGERSGSDGAAGAVYSTYADDPAMGELIEYFVAEMPRRAEALRAAVGRGDRAAVAFLAHQLMGASGGYGFAGIGEAARAVEQAAAEGAGAGIEELARQVEGLAEMCRAARVGGVGVERSR